MGDVDDDGVLDLIAGSGPDHAPEIVVYAGKAADGAPSFGSEITRFQPFPADVRGGVSVAAAQIDGTTADNIVVGSGPGIASEVRVYAAQARQASTLFASFSPYGDDRSGVSLATGFVDFATGRNSIVTAPGPGRPAEVKVFVFPLLSPVRSAGHGAMHSGGADQPVLTASFLPFADDYQGGVSLATGWLAGSLGGAKRIVVSQLAGTGTIKVYSSGSALDGGPEMYLHDAAQHAHGVSFREIASFAPFDGANGARVATTSTTSGADLLVSGVSSRENRAQVLRYDLVRPDASAESLAPVQVGEITGIEATSPAMIGGN
jgi:hypothetical protein